VTGSESPEQQQEQPKQLPALSRASGQREHSHAANDSSLINAGRARSLLSAMGKDGTVGVTSSVSLVGIKPTLLVTPERVDFQHGAGSGPQCVRITAKARPLLADESAVRGRRERELASDQPQPRQTPDCPLASAE